MSAEPAVESLKQGRGWNSERSKKASRSSGSNPPIRKDLSWRHATDSDLGSIHFTITLGRWQRQHGISKRANRVLRFFASLNRAGTAGYRGTRCSQGALAASIERATEEPASVRTVQRALGELVEQGYLNKSHAYGKTRQFGPDVFRREQICVYTLTEKAVAIWSKPERMSDGCLPMTKSRGDDLKKPEFLTQSSARADVYVVSDNTHRAKKHPAKPQQPPSTPKPYTKKTAKKAILKLIRSLLANKGRPGKIAVTRAAFELADGPRIGDEQSGINWKYWCAKWGTLSREERRNTAQTQLIPKLLIQLAPTTQQKTPLPPRASPPPKTPKPKAPSRETTIRNLRNLAAAGLDAKRLGFLARMVNIE